MGLTDNNSTTIPRIMVFRPTFEQMKDFSKYLEYMESCGANKAGLAKIIPPPEWCPRKGGYDNIDLTIKAPIQQVVQGGQGLYQQYNIQKRSISVKDFKKLAESKKHSTPQFFDYEDLERKYWKTIAYNPAIYGADVPGSLTDEDCKEFNINNLNTILDMINESYGIKIMGVNTAYLYFGMWKTTFAWHTEDMDLYSINYLHFGAPKSWYCIPPEHGKRLERLANGFFPNSYKTCPAFLRHKMTLISPIVLKKYSIPYNKITQESGEFMITFPYAYHAGYNHGYNCAESTNFALSRWVEYGKRALRCLCRPDAVKISMEAFVKRFQPDRYELWLEGKDIGPDPKDLSHICAAPAPSSYELNVMSKFGKHKRHPPHKKDYVSDAEENNSDGECSQEYGRMGATQTKASRKMFDADIDYNNDESLPSTPNFVSFTADDVASMPKPPSISDTILRLHKNLSSSENSSENKRKKKKSKSGTEVEPHLSNHTYAKPTLDQQPSASQCTQPNNNNNFLQTLTKLSSGANRSTNIYNNDCSNKSSNSLQRRDGETKNHSSHGWTPIYNTCTKRIECETVPPFIKPYYECATLDNMSASSQPPVLNPEVNGFGSNSIGNKCGQTITYGQKNYVLNLSRNNQMMVEASTSTEDLCSNNQGFNSTHSHNDEKLSVLEKMCRRTLQYIPPTFGPSPEGFGDEMKFNVYMSTITPHCAVCILLRPFELNETMEAMNSTQLDSWSPPKSSAILIPSLAFTSKVKDENTLLDSRETSPLIVCMDCRICVHSVCYGASDLLFDGTERNWRCDRCEKRQYFALCSLCPVRGGPLKECTDTKKWVHLTCALLVPSVKFVSGIAKRPIDLSELKSVKKSERIGCAYCRKNHPENKMVEYFTGYCIQCSSCYTLFHVTCGHRHGVIYQAGDWPDPIVITCNKCSRLSSKKKHLSNRELKDVQIGEKVIAKHRNSRYYKSKVVDIIDQVFHHIHFVDNSFTKTLKSCDILNRDCEKDPPEIGDPVEVIWNKEQLHGKYSGNHVCKLFSIMFDDNSIIKTKREDFYLLTDELPKGVQKKMSTATDMLHLLSEEDSNSIAN